jgi:hypothetical protein
MEYPHWLMAAGACLVVVGFIGLGFRRNKNFEPAEDSLKTAAPPKPARLALEVGQKAKTK